MEISDASKSVEGSEREKERLATSPALSDVMSEVRAMEGARVSIERMRVLSRSLPSLLGLPARSEKEEESTEITPSALEPRSGVKMAE